MSTTPGSAVYSDDASSRHVLVLWTAAYAAVLAALFVQLGSRNSFWFVSNWFVPDGITLSNTFFEYWSGRLSAEDISGGVVLNYLYYPAAAVEVVGFGVVNALLLVIACWWFRRVGNLAASIFLFPYFLLAVALPSKDIIMLVFSVALILTAQRHLLVAIALAIVAYFFRDGGAVIFGVFLLAWIVVRRWSWTAPYVVAAMFGGVLLTEIFAQQLFGELFIYARSLQIQQEVAGTSAFEAGSPLQAAIRVFGNATNLAFRPAIIDAGGGIALIGVAYLVCGVGLLYALGIATVQLFKSTDRYELSATCLLFASLAVASINPLVQPRYVLPAAALVVAIHLRTRSSVKAVTAWALAAGLALAGITGYWLSPIGLPGAVTLEYWWPYSAL